MYKFKQIIIIAVLFLFCLSVHAENFTVQKLPNGQTLVVYEIHNNPIVTIDTWIKTGSINETDKNNGISHQTAGLLIFWNICFLKAQNCTQPAK